MASAFDLDLSDETITDSIAPLFTLEDLDNSEAMLKWQNNAYNVESQKIAKYRESCLKNLALFLGRHYAEQGSGRSTFAESSNVGLGISSQKVSKLVVNHLADLVSQRVTRATQTDTNIVISPANAEYSDKVSARIVQYWIDNLLYTSNWNRLKAASATNAYIFGETYVLNLWNPNLGEVQQDWAQEEKQAVEEGRPPRLPLVDDNGVPIIGAEGKPLYIEKPVKTGDVELVGATPLNVIVQQCGDFNKADYFFYEEYRNIDEVKALYKDYAKDITADAGDAALEKWRSAAGLPTLKEANKVLLRHFYHRPNEFLASGRYVLSTRKVVLENKPAPKNQRGLPISRLTDIDVPVMQHGLSFFSRGKHINATINDLTSMVRRNSLMLAHPRWVVPRGSVIKKDALGNDITVIEYQGPTPPRIEAPPPLSQEINLIRADLKNDLQQMLGSSDTMRGQIPSNIRSASAMQMVDEQDQSRSSSSSSKLSWLARDVMEKAINTASCYYEKSDKRLIPVVGQGNRYLLKDFDPTHLTKSFDIRVADSSGLPPGKTAKTEMLIKLKEAFPNLIRDEQVAELLQFSDTETFYDIATVAVKAAEAENESILNGETADEPVTFENHVIHWTVHMREVQNRGFKVATPENIQSAMIAHVMATEMMMLMAARKNPAYSLELIKLPNFPAFFDLSHEDRILLDRARSGNPLNLVEIEMLEQTGTIDPMAGAGGVPPSGGVPNPSASQGLPLASVGPQQAVPGAAQPPVAGAPPMAQ